MTVVACLKWFTPRDGDERFGGTSPADEAALERALQTGAAWGQPVVAVALGPVAAEGPLRNALACGAARAIRVDAALETESAVVAGALAAVVSSVGGGLVCCGDYSLDRGTGSVPAFLAAHLGARQALGLVELAVDGTALLGLRRLDGGRRERVRIDGPAVVSVEGGTATLRRAALAAVLKARTAPIEVVPGPVAELTGHVTPTVSRPYRPRARVLPPPAGASALDRVKSLLTAGAPVSHGDPVELDPEAAADRILAALRDWGYPA